VAGDAGGDPHPPHQVSQRPGGEQQRS